MRLPRLRFTVRRMMVVVALIALPLGLVIVPIRNLELYYQLASRHAVAEAKYENLAHLTKRAVKGTDDFRVAYTVGEDFRAAKGSVTYKGTTIVDPLRLKVAAERFDALAAFHARQRQAYDGFRWWHLTIDLPEPPPEP